MKVLVTGATGYVGKHLLNELCNGEHEVYALIRNANKSQELKSKGVNLILGDIKDAASLERIEKNFDAIIHLAFSLFPGANAETNIKGFDNIVEFALKNPIRKFVFVSSQLVYGNTPSNILITEDHSCNTTMMFGKHQLRAENKLMDLYRTEGFPAIILRPSEIYGGKGGFFKEVQLDGYINGKIPVIGKGNNAISFTYIGDLLQLIIKSMSNDEIKGEIFNVSNPGLLTLNQLIELIKSKTKTKPIFKVPVFLSWIVASVAVLIAKLNGKAPFMDYDIVRVASMKSGERGIEKAKTILNFKPKYSNVKKGLIDCYFS